MSQTRSNHQATLLQNGEVLVTGDLGADAPTTEFYYSTSVGWLPLSSVGAARYRRTATLLTDGRIFVADGAPALNSTELRHQAIDSGPPPNHAVRYVRKTVKEEAISGFHRIASRAIRGSYLRFDGGGNLGVRAQTIDEASIFAGFG